ncbi:hypothetical protein T484DRAFT_1788781 [Baffinella frigidus]|nr:hypothetical protein T484DRAFT_1788781 [Cryptophyta sp. CCMP2293]
MLRRNLACQLFLSLLLLASVAGKILLETHSDGAPIVPGRSWGESEAVAYIATTFRRDGAGATLFWKVGNTVVGEKIAYTTLKVGNAVVGEGIAYTTLSIAGQPATTGKCWSPVCAADVTDLHGRLDASVALWKV